MFRIAIILVHTLIFILGFIYFIAPIFSIASPDPGREDWVWFLSIAIFEALVIASASVQLRVRKVWLFLVSAIGLIILIVFCIPLLVLYIESLI